MRTLIAPIFPLLLAGVGSFLLSSCGRNEDAQASAAAASEIPTVAVAKAATADLSRDLVLTAEFKPFQEVDLMAKVAGYVKEISVDVGDRVNEGELLATLEIPEMADDLRKSQAGVSAASPKWRAPRMRSHEPNRPTILRTSLTTGCPGIAEKTRPGCPTGNRRCPEQGPGRRSAARRRQLGPGRRRTAGGCQPVFHARVQTMIDYERVTAPFTGVVTKRYADTGSMIQAGTASQTQAMPWCGFREQSAALDSSGSGIRRPHRAHGAASGRARADVESRVSRAGWRGSSEKCRGHANHGHGGGRAQPEPDADSRNVRGGAL